MAKILLNTITLGTFVHYSGTTVPAELQAPIASAGGQLVDTVVFPAVVALAALVMAERHEGRNDNAERIMAAGSSVFVASATAPGAVQSLTVAITAAMAVAAGATTTLDVAMGTLPAGARLLGPPSLEGWTAFDDATHSTFAVVVGTSAGGNQIATTQSVAAGQSGFPKVMAAGAAGYVGAAHGGDAVSVRLTGGVNLSTVTGGAVTVKLFYSVQP